MSMCDATLGRLHGDPEHAGWCDQPSLVHGCARPALHDRKPSGHRRHRADDQRWHVCKCGRRWATP